MLRRSHRCGRRDVPPVAGTGPAGDDLAAGLGEEPAPAGLGVEPAADRQHRVPDRLGLQPAHVLPPEQVVGRVDAERPASLSARDDMRYADDSMMSLCSCLTDQPSPDELPGKVVQQLAFVGGKPVFPKSSGVGTIPLPKWYCQTRLTITRAVSGWSGLVIHSASARRRPAGPRVGGLAASGVCAAQHAEKRRLDFRPGRRRVAADQDVGLARRRAALVNRHRAGCRPASSRRWTPRSRHGLQSPVRRSAVFELRVCHSCSWGPCSASRLPRRSACRRAACSRRRRGRRPTRYGLMLSKNASSR